VDVATKHLALPQSPGYGIASGQAWYAENLLEEITVPGEYYVDRAAGVLYFLPPGPLAGHRLVASLLSDPVLAINGAAHLSIEGLTLESSRGTLVSVQGGSDVALSHVRLLAAGTDAAQISGSSNGISGCEITGPGAGGVSLSGGDRQSLTHGGNYVEYCHIHDFSRFEYMYHPAIGLDGAGQRASHNLLHDAPHSAILYGGNDQLIEKNEIHHVCQQTSDAGAIYSGRDWGARGNQIQFNYLHDISSVFEGYGVHAIYLDDCLSGIKVEGNVIHGVTGIGIEHGGGRDNVLINNVFSHTGRGVSADSRCVDWLPQGSPNNKPGDSWNLLEKLNNVGYQQDPWLTRFPECAAIPDDWATVSAPGSHWLRPEGCVFERNVGEAVGEFQTGSQVTFDAYASIKDNLPDTSVLFVDEAGGDLSIRPDSPAMSLPGFAPPPFADMGLGK
jgi:parallel beta-helix repeat protein